MNNGDVDVRTTLNVPMPVETKSGPVLVREMSVIDGMVAIDRVIAFCLALAQNGSNGDTTGSMLAIFRSDPTLVLSIVAPATDRDVTFLSKLSFAEFLSVLETFLDTNGELIDRFFVLFAKGRAIADRLAKQTATSRVSSPTSSVGDGATKTSGF